MNKHRVFVAFVVFLSLILHVQCGARSDDSTTDKASLFRDQVPRFGGDDEFSTKNTYIMGVAKLAIACVVLAALTLVGGLLFCICHCICKCRCCYFKPRAEGYSDSQRFIPFLILAVLVLFFVALSSTGLAENDRLSSTLTDESGDTWQTVIPNMFDAIVDKILSYQAPIQQLQDDLDPTVAEAVLVLDSVADTVANGTQGLVSDLNDLSASMSGLTLELSTGTYPCDYCSGVSTQISDTTAQVDTQTTTAINDIRVSLDAVEVTLVDVANSIRIQLDDVNATLETNAADLALHKVDAKDATSKVKDYDAIRNKIMVVVFVIPFIGGIFVLLGALLKSSKFFKCNTFITFVAMFIMWIMTAIHLPLSVVLADVCVYIDAEEVRILNKPDQMSMLASACIQNTSVLDALNLTDQLNFSEAIAFPEPVNFTGLFEFSELDQLKADVDGLTLATFGWDQGIMDGELVTLNSELSPDIPVPDGWTEANIDSLDPAAYEPDSAKVNAATVRGGLIKQLKADKQILQAKVDEMKQNVTNIVDRKNDLRDRMEIVQANVSSLENLLDPFIATAETIKDMSTCLFLADHYYGIKSLMCETTLGHVSIIAMCCFFVALFGLPVLITTQMSASRIPRPLGGFGTTVADEGTDSKPHVALDELSSTNEGLPPPKKNNLLEINTHTGQYGTSSNPASPAYPAYTGPGSPQPLVSPNRK